MALSQAASRKGSEKVPGRGSSGVIDKGGGQIMSTMIYKGYTARIEYDDRDEFFIGRILGVRDIISFHVATVAELRNEFELAVDDYLKDCAEQGKSPEKPVSGKFMLRVSPELHSAALIAAQSAGKSLNQWAAEVLQKATHHSEV